MLTDTGSFRYPNTTSFTHEAVAQLLKFDLDVMKIYKEIYGNVPYQDMLLLSKILLTLKCESENKIAWVKIRRNVLKNKKLYIDLTDKILSFARSIRGVEVAVLLRENFGPRDEVRINFRSQGKVDVNKIAQFFGGGGHKTASGATVPGKIDQVRKRVLAKIKESMKKRIPLHSE
jgi:bifunctional oligoribonuclease and PAP phosphatase NrnA